MKKLYVKEKRRKTLKMLVMLSFTTIMFGMWLSGCSSDKDSKKSTQETTFRKASDKEETTEKTDTTKIKTSTYSSGVAVHDPSVIKANGTYYIFGSHMAAAKSTDLYTWKSFADGVNASNKLFDNLFTDNKAFDYVGKNDSGGYSVWAPDVIYNEKLGKYFMYFCTTSTYIKSNLCYATSDNIEGPYHYEGTFLYSGFVAGTVEQTNVYDVLGEGADVSRYYTNGNFNNMKYPNAIDPTVFYDKEGKMWLTYGSWSGGVFILEIDENTGLPIWPKADEANDVDPYFGKHLVGGSHKSCEGPYIVYNKTSDMYYLFVSYGSLTRTGGYQIRMYRSENPDGPYVDAKGKSWDGTGSQTQAGIKLLGNYTFPSLSKAYMASGHNSAMIDEDGKMFLVYHTRFDNGTENHQPRTHQLFLNEDGWPCVAPYAYNQETISEKGYSKDDVVGTYYMVNMGSDISATICKPVEVELKSDGTVKGGNYDGTWEMKKNTPYVTIKLNNNTYKGVFIKMKDEAFTECMNFTAVGDNNVSIMGTKY